MLDEPFGLRVGEILTRDEDVLVKSHPMSSRAARLQNGTHVPPGPYERRRVKILGGMRPYKGPLRGRQEQRTGRRWRRFGRCTEHAQPMHNAYAKEKSREFGFRKGKRGK